MVRDACSDAGFRVAGDGRERAATGLMFPLGSLELCSGVFARDGRGAWTLARLCLV